MASSFIIGQIAEYKSSEEEWENYQKRLEIWMTVNKIEDKDKVNVLLAIVGAETFQLAVNLCSPDEPSKKSYADLTKLIKEHYVPPSTALGDRYKFNARNQGKNESISDYVVAIKKLAATCEFGSHLHERLRDRFVSGILSNTIRKKLLAMKLTELTWAKACSEALNMEIASKLADEMRNLSVSDSNHNASGGSDLNAIGGSGKRGKKPFKKKYR